MTGQRAEEHGLAWLAVRGRYFGLAGVDVAEHSTIVVYLGRKSLAALGKILRNFCAVVVGLILGSIVNMVIVMLGPTFIPLPEGVDMSDPSQFAENLQKLQPRNFLAPWLAHALGTLVGAFAAAKLSVDRGWFLAIVVSCVFLMGGVAMVVGYGGPIWFAVVDLGFAYLPMGYFGAKVALKRRPCDEAK